MKQDMSIILMVANTISAIVPNCCGVTLGGSRAYGYDDDLSDVEMYFYSTTGFPTLDQINNSLKSIKAKHKRSNEFLWNMDPWGPHSFFVVDGLYFEIGYRNIDSIYERIGLYFNGDVAPLQDCHDLGLGYMLSGLAASVMSEKELTMCGDEIQSLKQYAALFPDKLMIALKEEYLKTAKELLSGKLLTAAERADIFFYNIISSRIIRSLFIMAFAMARKHFPGDKWNENLLLDSSWDGAKLFIDLLKRHNIHSGLTSNELMHRRNYLIQALNLIEMDGKCDGKII